jgi:XTP/dITP diphosphohydrolase
LKLLIATRSAGKIREIRAMFEGLPFDLVFPADLLLEQLPEETTLERGATYVENAVAKARYFAERAGIGTIADDSGIEVDALGGAPGPLSARFSGGGDAANNRLLLERLAGIPEARRTARYRCVVAYIERANSSPEIVEAACEGRITTEPRGTAGFGYDPLFFSTDLQMTFGEASPAAKHRVSHRGRAFRALIEVLLRRST